MNTTARILAGKALADASRRMLKAAARMADADMEPRGQADALSMAERATTDADSALRELLNAEAVPETGAAYVDRLLRDGRIYGTSICGCGDALVTIPGTDIIDCPTCAKAALYAENIPEKDTTDGLPL